MSDTPLPAQESFDITPNFTPDQYLRMGAALKRRNEADYQCFMKLRELMDTHGEFIDNMVRDFEASDRDFEDDCTDSMMDEIDEVLAEREASNEEFLRAIANEPPLKE